MVKNCLHAFLVRPAAFRNYPSIIGQGSAMFSGLALDTIRSVDLQT